MKTAVTREQQWNRQCILLSENTKPACYIFHHVTWEDVFDVTEEFAQQIHNPYLPNIVFDGYFSYAEEKSGRQV